MIQKLQAHKMSSGSSFFAVLQNLFFFPPNHCRESISELDPRKVHPEEKVSLHQTPDPGAGEGVPVQHVPDQGSAAGGSGTLKSDRAAG